MPIESLLAPAEQARVLCAFLSGAKHQLLSDVASQIVHALTGTDKQAAQQLRNTLAGYGIQIKHMHALKAINVIRGVREYQVPGEVVEWSVVSWFDDSPASTPFCRSSFSLGKAADIFMKELSNSLEEESEFLYARITANDHSVELIFVGEPIGHRHWLLTSTDGRGNAKQFSVEQQARFVERVRRIVEGRHNGWVDGVFALQTFHQRNISYDYLDNAGLPRVNRYESEIVVPLESHARLGTTSVAKSDFYIRVGEVKLTSEDRFKLLARYRAWSSRCSATLSELIAIRVDQEFDERFLRKMINGSIVYDRIAELGFKLDAVAEQIRITAQSLTGYLTTETMPTALITPLAAILNISANTIYSEDNFRPIRMPVDVAMVAMTLSRFPHVIMETDLRYRAAQDLQNRLEVLCTKSYEQRQSAEHKGPSKELLAIAIELEDADMQFCLRINTQFVPDLPLGRERLAQIAVLSIVDTVINNQIPTRSLVAVDEIDEPWTDSDEKVLKRLNDVSIDPTELIETCKEHISMLNSGAPHGLDTMTFAAVRVFRSRPNHAHAAEVRMESMSRLMKNGHVPKLSIPAYEAGDLEMVSRPVFEAAAVCPLIRVGNRIGFDVRAFRLHMIKSVDKNIEK